jgi:conjugal transfer pilin signal peptidase TrbI
MTDLKAFCLIKLMFIANFFSFLKSRKQWVKGFVLFLIVFGFMAWLKDQLGIVYSTSASLPYRTFLHLKKMSPQKGSYTSFDSPWYGSSVIKKVVGTAGDTLSYDAAGNLWIERQLQVGKPKKRAKDGRVLTPLKSGVIPQGMVFVMGEHERSFDSRYEELGLIPEKDLKGRLLALV